MRRLLVFKDTAYGAKAGGGTIANLGEVDQLADGAIAIFCDGHSPTANRGEGTLVTAAGPTDAAGFITDLPNAIKRTGYRIYMGTAAGYPTLVSHLIPFGNAYNFRNDVAGTAQVIGVGDDGAGNGSMNTPTLTAGQQAHIRIQSESDGILPPTYVWNFTANVITGSDADSLIADLVAQINAHPEASQYITAGGINLLPTAGFTITADNVNETWEVTLSGVFEDATVDATGNTDTVAPVFSTGLASQVSELWEEYKAELGGTSQQYLPSQFFSLPNPVVSGVAYELYSFNTQFNKRIASGYKVGITDQSVELAVPDSATFQANLNTILQAFD